MKAGSFFLLLSGLFVAVAAVPGAAAPAVQERQLEYWGPISYGERVTAELTPDVAAHIWEFEGGEGDELSMMMAALAEEMDPFLMLLTMSDAELDEFLSLSGDEVGDLEAAAAERGFLLAVNDDWEETLDALIPSFVLPEDGRYFIVATSCCTGESPGPYELALDLVRGPESPPFEEPAPEDVTSTAPEMDPQPESFPEIQRFSPREGQAGTEVSLTIEGEGLSQLGPLLGLTIGGVNMQLFDYDIVDDQIIEVVVLIREDAPTGEHEISFIFENADLNFDFLVFEPDGRAPDVLVATPASPANPDTFPALPLALIFLGGSLMLGVTVLLGLIGLFVWRQLRPGRPAAPRREPQDAPPPPPDIRFKTNRDPGTQGVSPADQPIKVGVDIRFELGMEYDAQVTEEEKS